MADDGRSERVDPGNYAALSSERWPIDETTNKEKKESRFERVSERRRDEEKRNVESSRSKKPRTKDPGTKGTKGNGLLRRTKDKTRAMKHAAMFLFKKFMTESK